MRTFLTAETPWICGLALFLAGLYHIGRSLTRRRDLRQQMLLNRLALERRLQQPCPKCEAAGHFIPTPWAIQLLKNLERDRQKSTPWLRDAERQ